MVTKLLLALLLLCGTVLPQTVAGHPGATQAANYKAIYSITWTVSDGNVQLSVNDGRGWRVAGRPWQYTFYCSNGDLTTSNTWTLGTKDVKKGLSGGRDIVINMNNWIDPESGNDYWYEVDVWFDQWWNPFDEPKKIRIVSPKY